VQPKNNLDLSDSSSDVIQQKGCGHTSAESYQDDYGNGGQDYETEHGHLSVLTVAKIFALAVLSASAE
jgi:hypothetical protein